ARFSLPQRHVLGVRWYLSEVQNGGHHQFFMNPTGVLWPDALAGLRALPVPDASLALEHALERLGPPKGVSRDMEQRRMRLAKIPTYGFRTQDDALFALLNRENGLDAALRAYAQQHPTAFNFRARLNVPAMAFPREAIAAYGGADSLVDRVMRDPD